MTNVGMKTQFTEREKRETCRACVANGGDQSHTTHAHGPGVVWRWSVSDGIWKVATPSIRKIPFILIVMEVSSSKY